MLYFKNCCQDAARESDGRRLRMVFNKMVPKNKRIRTFFLLFIDAAIIQLSSFCGLYVRFDLNVSKIPAEYAESAFKYAPYYTVITILIILLFHLYATMWSVAGLHEIYQITAACGLSTLVQVTGMTLLQFHMPRSYFVICFFALECGIGGIRMSYRIYHTLIKGKKKNVEKRILIAGAGYSGAIILKEMHSSNMAEGHVVCFADDNKNKIGKYLNGVPVEGNCNEIPGLVEKHDIDDIYIAMPSATAFEIKKILEICKETKCQLKILPGIYQLLNGEVSVGKLRDVQIEDLLGREPVRVNLDEILSYVCGKVVLVTGGGGSIGSELCRQIASHNPSRLIVFDVYENNAYELQQELKERFPNLNLSVLIGSVRNTHRIESIFEKYHPNIVYHAAAHKHVPLMEDSPNEAIKNNVFGTYKTAIAADKYGTQRFVMISTDKAVNPTNIMGASKRICEMIIQMMNRHSQTDFVAVRFGNVLGSNGSVIPLFKKQIAEGGPVTVTHPDIIRYFMTIPEAVSLVLQAGAYAKGGEIFILDMGAPVKILELARNLIRLSGYEPERDIKIEFTGLRPGEKLYEELLMNEEGLQKTPNRLIRIGRPIEFDDEEFCHQLQVLDNAAGQDSEDIKEIVKTIIPAYTITLNQ